MPAPPYNLSQPSPAVKVSSPSKPNKTSFPIPPEIISLEDVPVIVLPVNSALSVFKDHPSTIIGIEGNGLK